jgi:hypothetical protein
MAILPHGAQAHHSSPLSVPWLMCAFLAGVVVFQHVNRSSVGVISGSKAMAPLVMPNGTGNAMKVHQLTGVYSCMGNGRLRAVREVLRRWRLFYPDAPVYIINDGGDKALEGIATEFGANYSYAVRLSSTDTTIFSTAVAAIAWVQVGILSCCWGGSCWLLFCCFAGVVLTCSQPKASLYTCREWLMPARCQIMLCWSKMMFIF